MKAARKRARSSQTGVRSARKAVRSKPKAKAPADSISAGDASFPQKAEVESFDRVADRCIAIIDDRRKRGTQVAFASAIATILDNAAPITERPAWTLGDSELLVFGKRLQKLQFVSYLDRLRDLLMRREWGDAYYVALQALREAGLA